MKKMKFFNNGTKEKKSKYFQNLSILGDMRTKPYQFLF